MTPLVIVLCIHSEDLGRGKRQATVEATTEDPNHEVRILAAGFVHGPHGTIGADLAVKVTPKERGTAIAHRPSPTREPSHPKPRRPWHTTRRNPTHDT